jgi:hypothetical protein
MSKQSIDLAVMDVELKKLLNTKFTKATDVADLTALRTSIVAILAAMDTLATKLNADAGVTDANYVTTNAATNTPAALTTVA